jgi:biotin carboxyl carrier protein
MKKFNVIVNGQRYDVEIEEIVEGTSPSVSKVQAPKIELSKSEGAIIIKAPMPGTIVETKVSVGENVKKGQTLILLEAMKMENEIVSPQDGIIASIIVKKGFSVEANDILVTLN